jgi:hypothetical protein
MKWMRMYLVGYSIVLVGLIAAVWKLGLLERVGPVWMAIGIAIAIARRHGLRLEQREEGDSRDRSRAVSPGLGPPDGRME